MSGASGTPRVALLLLLMGWGLAGEARAVEVYASEAGRFHVLLPAEPELRTRSHRTLLGRVRDVRYVVEHHGGVWAVETHDIPRGATLLMPARVILSRARKAFLADHDREELERSDTTRGGRPAQRIRYVLPDDPDWPRLALLVLVGNRIYIVISKESPAGRETLDPERFLDSFDFWAEASPPPRPSFISAPPAKP